MSFPFGMWAVDLLHMMNIHFAGFSIVGRDAQYLCYWGNFALSHGFIIKDFVRF